MNAVPRVSLKHRKTTVKYNLMSPRRRGKPETSRFVINLEATVPTVVAAPVRAKHVRGHRSYQELLLPPSRLTDSPSPHDCIVILYKLDPSHVLVAGHLAPSPFQCPESYPALSCHNQSTDSILRWGCCCCTILW